MLWAALMHSFCLVCIKFKVLAEVLLERSDTFRGGLPAVQQFLAKSEGRADSELSVCYVLDFLDLI